MPVLCPVWVPLDICNSSLKLLRDPTASLLQLGEQTWLMTFLHLLFCYFLQFKCISAIKLGMYGHHPVTLKSQLQTLSSLVSHFHYSHYTKTFLIFIFFVLWIWLPNLKLDKHTISLHKLIIVWMPYVLAFNYAFELLYTVYI